MFHGQLGEEGRRFPEGRRGLEAAPTRGLPSFWHIATTQTKSFTVAEFSLLLYEDYGLEPSSSPVRIAKRSVCSSLG